MSYIGNQPSNTAFLVDTFSGNGSTTSFTMSIAPATPNSVFVIVSGVVQAPNTYATVGNSLNFTQAPPTGTNNIVVRYLALPASNVTTTAYRNYSELTATAGQTVFSPASYTPGFIDVYRNGVKLNNSSFQAQTGSVVVLNTAANAGDSIVIISFYISSVLNAIPNTAGSVGVGNYDVSGQGGTGALQLPSGSTVQRPASPSTGMQRWNSTLGQAEIYVGGVVGWQTFASTSYTVDYLIVGGGGAGGSSSVNSSCGGGGAGGYITGAGQVVSPGSSYSIVVGSGGTGVLNSQGGSGVSSSAFSYTALGGGGGGGGTSNTTTANGANGGSGGGSLQPNGPGSGTAGQGNNGGQGNPNSPNWGGGGGGGAGAAGVAGTPTNAGAGGAGLQWYNGSYYAGGGGGATYGGYTGGSGGLGGGGAGGSTGAGTAGSPNTGGGGGAASYPGSSYGAGANGGSGVVIIRYLSPAQRGSGGTVSTSGGYYYHTFTSSGTYIA
jgi:hypothetical protein